MNATMTIEQCRAAGLLPPGDAKPSGTNRKVTASAGIVLPYPPSVNHYWRTFRGRMIISKEGREYREAVSESLCFSSNNWRTFTGRISVLIKATMPDNRRRDVDNIAKAILDALTFCAVWEDDSQIDRLCIERCGVEKPGQVIVSIERL